MNVREINFLLSDISELSEMLPLFMGLVLGIKKQPYVIILYLFVISAPVKLASLITAKLSINNMGLFHCLALCEVILLFLFYSKIVFGKLRWEGVAVLAALNILNSLFIEDLYEFNSLAWSFNTLVVLCLCLVAFYKMFSSSAMITLERHPTFIITSGWMIYCAGALFTYVLSSKILSQEARGFFHNAWIIQSVSNTIKNFIVSYGLWLVKYP